MQFTFPEEQQAFADSVRRFALAKLAPDALKRAHDPRYPFDVAKLMSAQGLMGISLPEADGGVGLGFAEVAIVCEELGRAAVPGPLLGTFLAAGLRQTLPGVERT